MKVLPFHIFDRTNVVALDTEPVHMCALTEDTFVSSHADGVVAVHRVAAGVAEPPSAPLAVAQAAPARPPAGEEDPAAARDAAAAPPLLAQFRAATPVVLALLGIARPLRAVATIEPVRPGVYTRTVLRVYTLPTDEGTSTASDPSAVPMWELPLGASALCAAVCPETGRLAVATREDVSVWAPVVTAAGQLAYERACAVACAGVHHVALHGAYLACATAHSVCVLECVLLRAAEAAAAAAHRAPPAYFGAPAHTECTAPVDDESLVRVVAARGVLCARPAVAELRTASNTPDSPENSSSNRPAFSVGPFAELTQSVSVEPQFVVRSLQVFFRAQYDRSEGDVHTLALLPEFSHITDEEDDEDESKDKEKQEEDKEGRLEMIGMRCFASTRLQGRLYNVRGRSVLASYRYTYLTVQCCVTDTLLYAVRAAPDAGLEAFTLRSSMNTAEYRAPAPCLLGTQPFLGPQAACVMGCHLLLLTKLTDPSLPDPEPISPFNLPNSRKQQQQAQQQHSQSPARGGARGRRAAAPVGVAWNVYLLHPTDAAQLHDEIVAYATTTVATQAEELNETVYYLLLLEAHFLVQDALVAARQRLAAGARAHDAARTLSARLELKRLRALLRGSAARLGDYYFFHAREYHKAAQCYSESSRTLVDVSRIFLQQEQGRAALLEYYDRVLFDPDMLPFMAEEPDLSNEILRYYVEFAPHRLSTVVIDSCLAAYSQRLALVLLDLAQHVRSMTAESRRSNLQALPSNSDQLIAAAAASAASSAPQQQDVPPKDLFAKALLTLDLEEYDTALAVLRSMRGDPVVAFCTAKPSLLLDEQEGSEGEGKGKDNISDIEALDRALRETAPECNRLVAALRVAAPLSLLEIATRLGPHTVSPAVLHLSADSPMLHAQKEEEESKNSPDVLEDENAFLLMCYLENQLAEPLQQLRRARGSRHEGPVAARAQDAVAVLAGRLAELYLARIVAQRETPFVHTEIARRVAESRRGDGLFCRWLDAHHNAFRTRRPAWMDAIPPFVDDEDDTTEGKQQEQKQQEQQQQSPSVSPRPSVRNPFHDNTLEAHDYAHFYVRKLESLLCSGLLGETTRLVALLSGALRAVPTPSAHTHKALATLRTLLRPLANGGRTEALGDLLGAFPLHAEEIGALYCADAADWAVVVARLLEVLRAAAPGTPHRAHIEATYAAVLARIATALTPPQFLRALPDDGNALFFLPFVERSCEAQLGAALRARIIRAMQDAEREHAQ